MKLIVLTDGEATSRRILPHAGFLKEAVGGELTLLRVLDREGDLRGTDPGSRAAQEERLVRAWESSQGRVLAELGIEGASRVGAARSGEEVPAAALRFADEEGARLIAMGTRGRSPIGDILFGSVAREVLKGARRPVLLVGPACEAPPAGEGYRLLVATDRSPAGAELLGGLEGILAPGGIEVALLGVYVPTLGDRGDQAEIRSVGRHLEEMQQLLPDSVQRHLLVRTLPASRTREGEILRAAAELEAGAVALCSKRFGRRNEPLVRSTVRGTIQRAPVPVLLVPMAP